MEATDSQQFQLEYYDYGTVCLHTLEELQPSKYPKMSQKARLHGVKPVDPLRWDREVTEAFQKLAEEKVGRDLDSAVVSSQVPLKERVDKNKARYVP